MTPRFALAIDPIFLHVLDLLDRIEQGEQPAPEAERLRSFSMRRRSAR